MTSSRGIQRNSGAEWRNYYYKFSRNLAIREINIRLWSRGRRRGLHKRSIGRPGGFVFSNSFYLSPPLHDNRVPQPSRTITIPSSLPIPQCRSADAREGGRLLQPLLIQSRHIESWHLSAWGRSTIRRQVPGTMTPNPSNDQRLWQSGPTTSEDIGAEHQAMRVD